MFDLNDLTNNQPIPTLVPTQRGLHVADLVLEEILDDALRNEVARRQEEHAYHGPAPEEILDDEERRLAERALYTAATSPEIIFDDELRAQAEQRFEDMLVPEELFDDELREAVEEHLTLLAQGAN